MIHPAALTEEMQGRQPRMKSFGTAFFWPGPRPRWLRWTSADEVARACIFQAIVGNASVGSQTPGVAIDLRRWQVDTGQGDIPLPVEAG
jgi:hypothetical protein